MLPTNFSIPEYQSFLMKLSKLTTESIIVKLIKNVMSDSYNSEIGGSVLQLGEFLKILLADFDDIDKYLLNADDLFRNIADLKELENQFEYLT